MQIELEQEILQKHDRYEEIKEQMDVLEAELQDAEKESANLSNKYRLESDRLKDKQKKRDQIRQEEELIKNKI